MTTKNFIYSIYIELTTKINSIKEFHDTYSSIGFDDIMSAKEFVAREQSKLKLPIKFHAYRLNLGSVTKTEFKEFVLLDDQYYIDFWAKIEHLRRRGEIKLPIPLDEKYKSGKQEETDNSCMFAAFYKDEIVDFISSIREKGGSEEDVQKGMRYCHGCFKPSFMLGNRMFACSRCLKKTGKSINYFGVECQKKHWVLEHKFFCGEE